VGSTSELDNHNRQHSRRRLARAPPRVTSTSRLCGPRGAAELTSGKSIRIVRCGAIDHGVLAIEDAALIEFTREASNWPDVLPDVQNGGLTNGSGRCAKAAAKSHRPELS